MQMRNDFFYAPPPSPTSATIFKTILALLSYCTSLSAERNEYIPSYYTNRASSFSFFHLFSTQTIKNHFCVNYVNIYKLLLRGSVFRVNIYCILRQVSLQKTRCESILFIFSPYCTRCSLMRIKLSCLVLLS